MTIDNIDFTFYADLLGVSNVYNIDPKIAYKKLNEYYNTTFNLLSGYCSENENTHVAMFSDSLLVYGSGKQNIIIFLELLYYNLLKKGLMLRGAIVDKALEMDPRLTLDNFTKQLPKNDTLARAVSLEKTQKGARLLVGSELAKTIFRANKVSEWLTNDGYIMNPNQAISIIDTCRRIAPTPDAKGFEVLYFWIPESYYPSVRKDVKKMRADLRNISKMVNSQMKKHYTETLRLLDRSVERMNFTEKMFTAS